MSFKSVISFASLLILFLELVALPFFLNAGNAKKGETVFKTETCCAKKAADGGCSKSSNAGSDGPECCLNCPLFYIMLTQQFVMPEESPSFIARSYPSYHDSYLFTYYCSAWKPPDHC